MAITLRKDVTRPLTIDEMDENFITLSTELGSKLNTSVYTAADVLTKLLTVDGSGSGLDADLLDGHNAVSTATGSTVVLRDPNGSFSANTITSALYGNVTGNLTGNATGSIHTATNYFAGNLVGNVTGNVAGNLNGTVGAVTPTSATFSTVTINNTLTVNSSVGTAGQILISRGAGLSPIWSVLDTTAPVFATGMIMMWSGTVATIPTGWYLCNGSNGTPDLRNKFIIGANSDDAGVAKTSVEGAFTKSGGTKDGTLVSHTHAATSTVTDPGHFHVWGGGGQVQAGPDNSGPPINGQTTGAYNTTSAVTNISVGTTIATAGTSDTNANLPPYYSLAYIMKS